MAKKITKVEVLKRLDERNSTVPPVKLFPKSQQYINQRSALQFKCEQGHVWKSTAERVIFLKRGCPECKRENERHNKRTPWNALVEKFNEVHNGVYKYDETTYTNSKNPVRITCKSHGDFFLSPYDHLVNKRKCPTCTEVEDLDLRYHNFTKRANSLYDNKYQYDKTTYVNHYTKMKIVCPEHGVFFQRPDGHLAGHIGCSMCSGVGVSRKQLLWLESESKKRNINIIHAGNVGEYHIPNTRYHVDGFHPQTNTVFEFYGDVHHGNINIFDANTKNSPFDQTKTVQQLYDDTMNREQELRDLGYTVISIWESDFDLLYDLHVDVDGDKWVLPTITRKCHTVPYEKLSLLKISLIDDEFSGYKTKHKYRCNICGVEFTSTLTQRIQAFKKYGSVGCPCCSSTKNTYINDIKEMCEEMDVQWAMVDALPNVLWLKGTNVAVYVQPLKASNKTFLLDMQKVARDEHNLELKVIFVDEISNNRELVKLKLAHYAMKATGAPVVYARKCTVQEIDSASKNAFLNQHHIQGTDTTSQVMLGLLYGDDIVAVMTFCKPRVIMGQKNSREGIWELSRFATDTRFRLPGAASKVLSYFKKHYEWSEIYSYADRRWSVGNLYDKLGFELINISGPSYWYNDRGIRKHRWQFRKDGIKDRFPEVYNPEKTEAEMAKEIGLVKVWDCGTLKYSLSKRTEQT